MTTITRSEVIDVPGSGGAPDVAGVDMRTSNPETVNMTRTQFLLRIQRKTGTPANMGSDPNRSSIPYLTAKPRARAGVRLRTHPQPRPPCLSLARIEHGGQAIVQIQRGEAILAERSDAHRGQEDAVIGKAPALQFLALRVEAGDGLLRRYRHQHVARAVTGQAVAVTGNGRPHPPGSQGLAVGP